MSEKLAHQNESLKPREHSNEAIKHPEVSVEQERQKQHEALTAAEKAVEATAKSRDETQVEDGSRKNEQPLYVNAELKRIALDRTLARARRQLSSTNKLLSKVIHKPVVQAVSEAGAKTVARPSGLLLGGVCAFIGSSLALYLSRHYGYSYNYLLFFVLFGGGFIVGLVIELVVWLVRRRRVSL